MQWNMPVGTRSFTWRGALVCGLHHFSFALGAVDGALGAVPFEPLAIAAVPAAKLIARRCASACARTLAKPAGLVILADWPASEFAQRLHSSNSTAWSSRS